MGFRGTACAACTQFVQTDEACDYGVDVDENPFGGTGRAALRRACRARGVSVSVSSAIENESLFE